MLKRMSAIRNSLFAKAIVFDDCGGILGWLCIRLANWRTLPQVRQALSCGSCECPRGQIESQLRLRLRGHGSRERMECGISVIGYALILVVFNPLTCRSSASTSFARSARIFPARSAIFSPLLFTVSAQVLI